jgi:Zn-dependent protease
MGIGRRWKVATVRGIPLYVSVSWVAIAVLFVFTQYAQLEDDIRVSQGGALALSVFIGALFFGSVLLHEAAHAVMARRLDLPVLGVTLVFWGGATETKASARGPKGEFLVAMVGPATTLVLAGVFWVMAQATDGVASELIAWLAWLSLIFAAINTVPGFPLDGGRMLLAAIWGLTGDRRTAMRATGYVGIAIGAAAIALAIWLFANRDGYWLFVGYIGLMIFAAGRAMDGRIAMRDQLGRGTVADAMTPAPVTVPADTTLIHALDSTLRDADGRAFPVTDAGRLVGTVSIASASRVGARDPMRPVRDGMLPIEQTPLVSPDETLDDALEWLGGRDGLVVRDGTLMGAISPADIERWYRRVIEGRLDIGRAAGASLGPDTGVVPPRPDL